VEVPPASGPTEGEITSEPRAPQRAWPTSTYRVQLHADFTFDDAAALAPYLAALGISHLYCSPVLQAAPGSAHGYDVVDHGMLSEDLGGPAAFARMVDALADHGLSVLLDTVPNHMALAGSSNRWWWDVLEDGPASRYAGHFDIDWSGSGLDGGPSVLMPILGDHVGRVLEDGELGLARKGGVFVVTYHDHELPVSPRSVDDLLALAAARAGSAELAELARGFGGLPHAARGTPDVVEERHRGKLELRRRLAALAQLDPAVDEAIGAELAAVVADPDAFDALLARQNYRLAHWRTADEELDYRRFFSITTLVGVRVEDQQVFDESHRLLAELVHSGRVAGLRIDHVDGLRDPAGYLQRLRDLAPEAYIVVEKILQSGESLPGSWPVEGTSGYDHLIAVNDLFVDPNGEEPMTAGYDSFVGGHVVFRDVEHESKRHVMTGELAAETERLTGLLARVCATRRRHRDHTRRELREVLREVLAGMPVYRTYVVPGQAPTATDRAHIGAALASAAQQLPDVDDELLQLLGRVLLLEEQGEVEEELAVRFQQLSAPVMAKGIEDTAFYRYGRLVSLNEVGGDPARFGREPREFHEHCSHLAQQWPATMLTLSTHDTKRSADVRARLAVLSEIPDRWWAAVDRWSQVNERHRRDGWPDRETELLAYQTLVGAWPIEPDRLVQVISKSTKEAKTLTSWTSPNQAYDEAVERFVRGISTDDDFTSDVQAFLEENRILELGRVTSLAQAALLVTSPGVPDIYQGTELWDLSLVDPDNRRPVDHDLRRGLLDELHGASAEDALTHLDDGGAKLWMLARILRHRRRDPALFQSSAYEPLDVDGPKARHAVAFRRERLVVVVPRLLAGLGGDWEGTTVDLPSAGGPWIDLLSGTEREAGQAEVGTVLDRFPVSVMVAGEER